MKLAIQLNKYSAQFKLRSHKSPEREKEGERGREGLVKTSEIKLLSSIFSNFTLNSTSHLSSSSKVTNVPTFHRACLANNSFPTKTFKFQRFSCSALRYVASRYVTLHYPSFISLIRSANLANNNKVLHLERERKRERFQFR